VPAGVNAGRTIRYAAGAPEQLSATIAGTNIRVFRRLPVKDTAGAQWTDSYGEPLLAKDLLYTHFNPAWNELPWSGEFPEKLLELMLPAAAGKQHDRRRIDARQLVLPAQQAAAKPATAPQQETPLAKTAWIALLLVFCAERYLSFKTTSTGE
jgi:hypothetical protein